MPSQLWVKHMCSSLAEYRMSLTEKLKNFTFYKAFFEKLHDSYGAFSTYVGQYLSKRIQSRIYNLIQFVCAIQRV